MKHTQRAILHASLFILTTVTFGNSSAMDKREESPTTPKQTTLKQLTRDKPGPDKEKKNIDTKKNNSRVLTIGLVLFGSGVMIACPQPYWLLGPVVAVIGPKIIKIINEHKNSTGHAKSS